MMSYKNYPAENIQLAVDKRVTLIVTFALLNTSKHK